MKTIAIVDDFKQNTAEYCNLFQNSGYKVIELNLPSEALKVFNGKQIDILICDYNMSEMSGIDFIKKIKSFRKYENLPVLLLSSERGNDVRQEAKEAGAYGWVKKPFSLKSLLNIVNKIVSNNKITHE